MIRKRFYDLLGRHPRSAHPGRFEITEVWDEGRLRVLRISLVLMFKNESVLCVDKRYPARCVTGRAGAFERVEFLREIYQRWYDEWLVKSKFKQVSYKEFSLGGVPQVTQRKK